MHNDIQLLAEWGKLAGFSHTIKEPDNLTGLFQCFREDPDRVASLTSLLDGVDPSGVVLARLLQIFAATKDTDPNLWYFVPPPQPDKTASALALAVRHRDALAEFVKSVELKRALSEVEVVYNPDPSTAEIDFTTDPRCWAYEAVGDTLTGLRFRRPRTDLHLLVPAAYSIANQNYVAAHVLWPLYDTLDPALFESFFELWLLGYQIRSESPTRWVVTPVI